MATLGLIAEGADREKMWETIFARHNMLVRLLNQNHGASNSFLTVKEDEILYPDACDCVSVIEEQVGLKLFNDRIARRLLHKLGSHVAHGR